METGTTNAGLTVENLETLNQGTANATESDSKTEGETMNELQKAATQKRPAINWDDFGPSAYEAAKAGKTQSEFFRDYSAKKGIKELTVQQKFVTFRKSLKDSKDYPTEVKNKMLDAIQFKDGRRVKGIKRVHTKVRTKKQSPIAQSLASIMGLLGDIPTVGQTNGNENESSVQNSTEVASTNPQLSSKTELVGQQLMQTPIPGVMVGQSPLNKDITIQYGDSSVTIHRNESQLVGV
jgi:hypothetical protein